MKFNFENKQGETLSGRLESPTETPRAYALFAHCFTCSKDIIAANVISKKLTDYGFAVLRFDFTGLGNSQGDFANTNFSSNIEDLVCAYHSIKDSFKAPQILIGHSLGGAAVLKAAKQMEAIQAVVTIGAPSSVDHVAHLFENDRETIEKEGQAQVNLAGRQFTIKKQFIDDIVDTEVLKDVTNLKKALLILHSPIDNTVSIDHAGAIFGAAKHPKSFISLDKADHLLMNRSDAEYAAQTIAAWASKYTPSESAKIKTNITKGSVVVRSRPGLKFTNDILTHQHHLTADEPLSIGGNDFGLSPYELLLASLGACTSMTLRMYADRKKMNLKNVEVSLCHQKIKAEDCTECETQEGLVDCIDKHITLTGNLTQDERQRLYEIAERCPVNRSLQSEIIIRSHHPNA